MAESLAASGDSISNAVVEVFPSTREIPVVGPRCLSSASTSKTPPYSRRIAIMMQERENCSDEVEFDIAFSKDHWTAVDDEEESEDDESCVLENHEALLKANQEALENLKSHPHWGPFFLRNLADITDVDFPMSGKVGKKIAEGGQAKIYESSDRGFVFKVFKRGFLLQELQKQWPKKVFSPQKPGLADLLQVGTVLDDGRFAFVLRRYWGDLRRLMDLRMLENKNSGAPFLFVGIRILMETIVRQMGALHRRGVCHKDLKADNILVRDFAFSISECCVSSKVADYECSIGVLGTTFWRAPEILLAERNFVSARRNWQEPPPIPFSKAADVYSFGMLLYEISTGFVPFEREGLYDKPLVENFDRVIRGERPELPDDMDWEFKDLITKCWHSDAKQRPTFEEIWDYVIRFELRRAEEPPFPGSYFARPQLRPDIDKLYNLCRTFKPPW